MSDFVNIRPGNDTPLLLNTRNLSVIMRLPEHTGGPTPAKMTLGIYDSALGRQLWFDEAARKIDPTIMISEMEKAGVGLFAIPLTWSTQENYGTAFVNPKSFLSLITSAPYVPDDKNEAYVSVLLDVTGYGRIESDAVPVKLIEDFMQQVKASKPNLMTIDPKTATSRFTKPGYVTFDANRVEMIRPNGYDLDVYLHGDVTGGARIDFRLMGKHGKDTAIKRNDYTIELIRRATARGFLWATDPQEKGDQISNVFKRTQRHYEMAQTRLKDRFATAIASRNPNIVKIENASDVYYTITKVITAISCDEKRLLIHFNGSDSQRTEPLYVRFESEDKAKNEAKRLQKLLIDP